MRQARRVVLLTLLGLTLVVVAYWAVVFFSQRSLMYPAPPVGGMPERPGPVQQVWLEIPGAKVEAWYLPAASRDPAPLLIYTHGNGELIDLWPPAFAVPQSWGVAALLVEYPGYGRSTGVPTQTSITDASLAAYDWAVKQPGVDPKRIVAHGRSLGGGAACALASKRNLAGLILESTFTSVRPFARSFRAPGFLVRDPFDNLAVVKAFRGPVMILHGAHDEVIPVQHGRELAAAAPQAELHLLQCGHNDCPKPWDLIGAFLKRNGLI
jgi:uncharacterized protein